ncbi:MAG: Peptidase [Gemmatimonadetes bacterium]|nr:Peptidase [Gemmatimonadota bacterium]
MTRLILAWLHLLALAVGLAGLWARARALRATRVYPSDAGALSRAFTGDTWWGIAAVLWLTTGLWRLIGHTEKSTDYYTHNLIFFAKMGLFLGIFALEIWPMITLIRWRTRKSKPSTRVAVGIEYISYLQCLLVLAIVLAAVSMARGYGAMEITVIEEEDVPVTSAIQSTPKAVDSTPKVVDAFPAPAPAGTETVTTDDEKLLATEIATPLDGVNLATIHSTFNERRGGGTRPHEALDLMAARGTPVKAAAKGRVLKLFTSVPGGLMIYATDSPERFILLYGHLDSYAPGLRDGASIERGQVIGAVGSTGNAAENAPHLHFAIARSADVKQWWKGKPIDPLPVLARSHR